MEEADLLVRYPQRVPIAPEPTFSTEYALKVVIRADLLGSYERTVRS